MEIVKETEKDKDGRGGKIDLIPSGRCWVIHPRIEVAKWTIDITLRCETVQISCSSTCPGGGLDVLPKRD